MPHLRQGAIQVPTPKQKVLRVQESQDASRPPYVPQLHAIAQHTSRSTGTALRILFYPRRQVPDEELEICPLNCPLAFEEGNTIELPPESPSPLHLPWTPPPTPDSPRFDSPLPTQRHASTQTSPTAQQASTPSAETPSMQLSTPATSPSSSATSTRSSSSRPPRPPSPPPPPPPPVVAPVCIQWRDSPDTPPLFLSREDFEKLKPMLQHLMFPLPTN